MSVGLHLVKLKTHKTYKNWVCVCICVCLRGTWESVCVFAWLCYSLLTFKWSEVVVEAVFIHIWFPSFALPRWNDSEMQAPLNSFENYCVAVLWGWLETETLGFAEVQISSCRPYFLLYTGSHMPSMHERSCDFYPKSFKFWHSDENQCGRSPIYSTAVHTPTHKYSPDHHPELQSRPPPRYPEKKPTQTYSPDHHPELQSRPPPRAPVQTSIQISSPDPHPDTTVQTSTQIPESRPPSRYSISDPHLERREDALIYTQTSQHQSLHVSLCL